MKFLPPDKMVQNLQIGVYGVLVALAFLTYIISPPQGTAWYILTGSLGLQTSCNWSSLPQPRCSASWGPSSGMLVFHSAATCCSSSQFYDLRHPPRPCPTICLAFSNSPTMLSILVVVYSVLLIMYFELSNGVIRYSMLDTSIRTNEVYVMNPKENRLQVSPFARDQPVLATLLAWFVLSANTILPAIVGIFSSDTALRECENLSNLHPYTAWRLGHCLCSSRWAFCSV